MLKAVVRAAFWSLASVALFIAPTALAGAINTLIFGSPA